MKSTPINSDTILYFVSFFATLLFWVFIIVYSIIIICKYKNNGLRTVLVKLKSMIVLFIIPLIINITSDLTLNNILRGFDELSKCFDSSFDDHNNEETTNKTDNATFEVPSITNKETTNNDGENQIDEKLEIIDYSSLDVVLVVDQSLSMKEYSDPYKITTDAAKLFVDLCKEYDNCNLSLVTFANEPKIIFKNKNSKTDYLNIISKINQIEYNKKNTNVLDALNCADDIVKNSENKNSKKIVLLISDGKIDVSKNEIENEKLKKGIEDRLYGRNDSFSCPIYTIGLDSENEKYRVDEELMIDIANNTGGDYKIIKTKQGLSDIKDEKQNLYLFITDIINSYMGTKITKSNIIHINSNSSETIKSEKVKYSDNGQLIVYGDAEINIDSLNIRNNSDKIVGNKGEHYIIVNFDEPDNQRYEYRLYSKEDVDVRYAFIYNYDISLKYDIKNSIMIGEPLRISGQLVTEENIKESDVTPYLYILTEDDYRNGNNPTEYKLFGNNGFYYLDNDYIFPNTGKYFCKFVYKSNDGSFERGCEYKEINIIDPKINVLSTTKSKGNRLNVAFDFSLGDASDGKRKCMDCFDVELSLDNVNFFKAKSNNDIYEVEIPYKEVNKIVDLFIKISLNNKYKPLVDNGTYLNTIKTKNVEIKNSAPYAIKGNRFIEKRKIMFFNDNKIVVDLKDYFDDDSSTFNIDYELIEATEGTNFEIYNDGGDSKKLLVTSNAYGNNSIIIRVNDIDDSSLISEPIQIDFNSNIYFSGMGLYLYIGVPYISISIIFLLFKRRRDKAISISYLMNGMNFKKKLYKKTTKVSKLIDNPNDRTYYKNIKIKILSRKNKNISIIYPNRKDGPYNLDKCGDISIKGDNGSSIIITKTMN